MKNYSRLRQRGIYRSKDGIILGVCRGIADYFDFSVFWVRVVFIVLTILTKFWIGIGIYILAAVLMKSQHATASGQSSRDTFEMRFETARQTTTDKLKRKWHRLEKRLRNLEDRVTSKEYDWNARYNKSDLR